MPDPLKPLHPLESSGFSPPDEPVYSSVHTSIDLPEGKPENERANPRQSMEPPAVFANGYHVVASPPLVRIAFAESTEGVRAVYRSAIVMAADDAKGLANAILRLVTELGDGKRAIK